MPKDKSDKTNKTPSSAPGSSNQDRKSTPSQDKSKDEKKDHGADKNKPGKDKK